MNRKLPFSTDDKHLTPQERERRTERTIRNLRTALSLVEKRHFREIGKRTFDEQAIQQNALENLRDAKGEIQDGQFLKNKKQNTARGRSLRMGNRKLEELASKGSTEVLLSLDAPRSGFMELLNSDSIFPQTVALILKVLAKVCLAQEVRLLASLVSKIASETQFLQKHLQKYMLHTQTRGLLDVDLHSSLDGILSFLSKFQEIQPATSSDVLTILIPTLNVTLEKVGKFASIAPSVNRKLKELQSRKDAIIEEHDPKIRRRMATSERLHSQQPPEDYTTIPVLPTKEDLANKRPFLRPNIVHGSYLDAKHYLDVQFRLLREDYIRPLRDSVGAFKTSNQSGSNRISAYRNVQVLCPFNRDGGLVHLISFDPKPFAHVRWDVSKRFMPGSLLCLSCNNFETMLFATVAKRDPEQLKKGRLEIHFEELKEEIFSISPSAIFVMVENEAYFEAFRHTLACLQEMDESTLPLKDYIVNVNSSVQPPKYLRPSSSYSFSSTFPRLKEVLAVKNEFSVLTPECWPSCEELGLDFSQYSALQAALTKEFAIIQGPPGTGKTYIGLKITQMLLENSSVWQSSGNGSILVVCYTNHALDQFLEGMFSFTDAVVRVGGRSDNDAIKKFQLGELRKAARQSRKVPKDIYLKRKEVMEDIRQIENVINDYTNLLEKSTQQILPFFLLEPFMGRRHSESLVPREERRVYRYSFAANLYAETFQEWLGFSDDSEFSEEETKENSLLDDNLEDKGEDEIDFQLSLREIDDEYSSLGATSKDDVWKTMGKRKRRRVQRQILSWDMMTRDEAIKVGNLWKLEPTERWRLYRLWVAQYIANLLEIITCFQKSYHNESEKLRELRTAEDKNILKEAKIIGMTTTGASKYHEYLQELKPQIVIVEEAAEVLEAHIVTSLSSNTKHLILIGDHQQLKPSPTVYELAVRYSLDISLFERMINNGMSYCQLTKQHRMRPCIAKLLTPHVYKHLENHHSVEDYENIAGVGKNMFFINHSFIEGDIVDTKSHSNLHEAEFLVALCKYLRLQGYDASRITVLTTYSGQLFTIRQRMKGKKLLDGIRVTVVDNFQGEENDIILLSLVRSNDDGSIGFLKVSNRVCVALSRARKGLYCIGNFELLTEKSELWRNIIGDLEGQKAIGTSLVLCCQNHPSTENKVKTADDFAKLAPDGGCLEPCNFRLSCGHVCPRSCHPDDKSHKERQSMRRCEKIICSLGHKCPKLCYEECGKCIVPLEKYRPLCGHTISVACHLDPDEFQCNIPCVKKLPCGHSCGKRCCEQCEPCNENVKIKLECGHHITAPCCKASDVACPKPCRRRLPCGHVCKKECGIKSCPPCEYLRKVSLSCGHEWELSCSDLFRKTEIHCDKACGKKLNCTHKCQSICGHSGECEPCYQSCHKLLQCSHRCTLKCSDICPELCEVCKPLAACISSTAISFPYVEWSDFGDNFAEESDPDSNGNDDKSDGILQVPDVPSDERDSHDDFEESNAEERVEEYDSNHHDEESDSEDDLEEYYLSHLAKKRSLGREEQCWEMVVYPEDDSHSETGGELLDDEEYSETDYAELLEEQYFRDPKLL